MPQRRGYHLCVCGCVWWCILRITCAFSPVCKIIAALCEAHGYCRSRDHIALSLRIYRGVCEFPGRRGAPPPRFEQVAARRTSTISTRTSLQIDPRFQPPPPAQHVVEEATPPPTPVLHSRACRLPKLHLTSSSTSPPSTTTTHPSPGASTPPALGPSDPSTPGSPTPNLMNPPPGSI